MQTITDICGLFQCWCRIWADGNNRRSLRLGQGWLPARGWLPPCRLLYLSSGGCGDGSSRGLHHESGRGWGNPGL